MPTVLKKDTSQTQKFSKLFTKTAEKDSEFQQEDGQSKKSINL